MSRLSSTPLSVEFVIFAYFIYDFIFDVCPLCMSIF